MPIKAPKQSGQSNIDRKLLDKGQHPVRLVQVIDLGLQKQRPFQGQEKKPAFEVYLTFEFPHSRIDVQGESRPMWKSKRFKLSSHEKSTCVKWYERLDPDNNFEGDWAKLVNTSCAAFVSHDAGSGKNEGKIFDNISDVMPVMQGMEVPPLENPSSVFDLSAPDMEVWEKLPDWLQNIIKENLQYDGSRLQHAVEGTDRPVTASTEGADPSDIPADKVSRAEVADFDDDVPF